ncbi:LCP family protein [Brevibacterium jeotgali]|uniref:Transcriptional attenuator, LytR family n=1 Tax=Brevibacterium jeotgali TaxID=1262550 RepID=A0A2H1L1B5_9MICO|nr:LCP family protein [Brevibacterium jeotgali]TWC01935.1 LytR family transcriptional attenuator [Brevibacterium jeotgali]SMY10714.1 transcriptional attenuator, LytR family [Brevibacterium jeotgali]
MADADDRRGDERPGSDPSAHKRPLRASDRARLRGEDGVRRDDYFGARDSDLEAAAEEAKPADGAMPAAPRTGTAPSHSPAGGPAHTPAAQSPTSDSAADSASQGFTSRRARREALAREKQSPRPQRRRGTDAAASSATPTFGDESRPTSQRTEGTAASAGTGAVPAAAAAAAAPRTGTAPGAGAASASTRDDDRPRHSRREGDAFPTIVKWTTLGTLLPGLGMIRGRSRTGWILLLGFLAAIVVVLAWVVWRSPLKAVARVAGSPTILYALAVVLAIGIIIWGLTILRSYAVLRRGHRITDLQTWLGWGLVASLVLCVGIPLGIGSAYSKVHADAIVEVFGRDGKQGVDIETLWGNQERINVFLIGRDNGDGREGTRPDTMLVASIKPHTGDTTLISVPRNLNSAMFPEGSMLAERFPEGFNAFGPQESMINAVWTWAEEYPEDVGEVPEALDPGMEATMQAVEGSLGLGLDYYASVDMQGFEDVVDAIGGVEIDVERPIPMGGGTNLNTGMKNQIYGWIDPGEQKLSGQKALWYVRSRDGSDNYDRMCRQQRMLKSTLDQVDPQELAIAYPKLAGSAGRNILTDIPQSEVSAFVELAAAIQSGVIKSAQINNDVTSTYSPDYEVLHEWVDEQITAAAPSQAEEQQAPETEETEESEATEETEESEPTEAPMPGVENDAGKCYPEGYEPGSGWPGWPGPEES